MATTSYQIGRLNIGATIIKETKNTISAQVTFPTGLTKTIKFKKNVNLKGIATEVTTGYIIGGKLFY